jgi:hypothetical protein
MSRAIGRIFIVALLSAAVAWGVWAFALRRPDMQMQLYARSAELRNEAARPKAAAPGSFQAVACAAGPCLLVEAGGQAFLVGAGDDAAEGLETNGLMRADIKAILLTDLTARSVAGLPSLRDATWRSGRRAALSVYGPAGVDQVIAGANALLDGAGKADPEAALMVGHEVEGAVFSGGGVSIASLPVAEGAARIYRFDFGGKVLLVGGCDAAAGDLVAAARGASSVYAVLPATSTKMVEIEQTAAKSAGRDAQLVGAAGQGCLSVEDVSKAVAAAHLNGAMLAPLYPAPRDAAAVRAWGVALAAPAGVPVSAGAPGALLAIDSKPRPAAVAAVAAPAPATAPTTGPTTTAPTPAPATPATIAPKPVPTLAPKPAPVVTPPKPAIVAPPKPSPAITTAPRPRNTPKPVATPSAAAPTPDPTPSPTAIPEPPPAPIFPLRSGLPQTDSLLRVGPRLSPTPSPTPGQ